VLSCQSCGAPSTEHGRFCSRCGASLAAPAEVDETRLAASAGTRARATPGTGFVTPSTDFDHGRFLPGTTLADRYRVIGRVGKGGMGEIYRADDLRLGQQVALKFLPDDVANDAARLAQFHAEVRLARQVSHPNVCRVYDVEEAAGRTFLSMEYIDGEDLASLLRRIGRLPQDKALELARQLCAGLAASHERGVIHRDLKPANLMIDGEGRLRITDFGIAALTASAGPAAGTPGYMAPELLAGTPATVRSDIYALGLVLYELFTGRKAFAHGSLAEMVRAQQETQPESPTTYVRDLDPAVERTILRCLQREAAQRPASALAVSAMLPGGDPLAAALAAGETPSPEMVAAAGEAEALKPGTGAMLLLAAAAGLAALLLMADRTFMVNFLPLDKPPEVLADRANEILAGVGYTARNGTAEGFTYSGDYVRYLDRTDTSRDRWNRLRDTRGPSVVYWYRSSPRAITPLSATARPALHDPPMTISGQAGVILDTRGRLIELHGVPAQFEDTPAPSAPTDWKRLFDASQLDMSRFTAAAPAWTPRTYADTRVAWTGTVPEHPGLTLRVDAASYRGRPVFFALTGPWTQPSRMQERQQSRAEAVLGAFGSLVLAAIFVGAGLLAARNAKRHRADWRGARLSATVALALSCAARLLRMTHTADPAVEMNRIFQVAVQPALFDGVIFWSVYMAVEPAVRRFWPDVLKGWSRVVAGRVRDARVGRDLLYGAVVAMALSCVGVLHDVLPPLFGYPQPYPTVGSATQWLGTRAMLAEFAWVTRNALSASALVLFIMALLRMLLRSRAAAAVTTIVVVLLIDASQTVGSSTWLLDMVFATLLVSTIVAAVVTLGWVGTFAMFSVYNVMMNTPLTSSFGAWYGRPSAWAMIYAVAVAATGFWLSRGGAPLFGRALLDE
jgi:serine/threonine-protein kinase